MGAMPLWVFSVLDPQHPRSSNLIALQAAKAASLELTNLRQFLRLQQGARELQGSRSLFRFLPTMADIVLSPRPFCQYQVLHWCTVVPEAVYGRQ